MRIIRIISLIIALLSVMAGLKAQNHIFQNFSRKQNTFEVQVNNGVYVLTPYSNSIVHAAFYPDSGAIKNYSFAAVMQPKTISAAIEKAPEKITLTTGALRVEIHKSPFSIRYYHNDSFLFSEKEGYAVTDTSSKRTLSLEGDAVLYGGGERVLGMNRRGHRLQIYNRAHYGYTTHSELMNYAIPMYLSSKKYAVLFDNASHAFLDLDSKGDNTVTYETFGGTTNYFVVAGEEWYDLTRHFTQLTGRQPLPPRWAFGNFSSRFGYHSQEEVLATIDKFFRDSIPVDAVILDLYWFGPDIKGHMGNLSWDEKAFPAPEKMMDSLKSQGVKTILVTEPFILTTSDRWKEAVRENVLGTDSLGFPYTYDFYFGNTGLVDVFKLSARRWFWDIYKGLDKQGVDGWWGDLGEPEVHPAGLQHVSGSAEELHNAYGHEWAGIIYEGYRRDFPEKRPFILMRSGFAGSQRYGIIPWTGDVSRSWGGLVPQPEISLQMGMQGVAYTHSDLGGFAGGDSLNNELYTRWMQYGVFQPIYRPHAQEEIPSEPVFWPEETKNRSRKAIQLRYRLLPYIYNMAFENSRQGIPLMIPLFFEEPGNRHLLTYDSAYLWGKSLLVSPVKQPGVQQQTIYFPEGQNWYDFFTGKAYRGGTTATVDVTMEHIPVFARGGAFIPMKEKAESTGSYNLQAFDMHYYADEKVPQAEYKLYNDDGATADAYEKGMYEQILFTAKNSKKMLNISIAHKTGDRWSDDTSKEISLIVHNISRKPEKIRVDEQKIMQNQWSWDKKQNTIEMNLTLEEQSMVTISK